MGLARANRVLVSLTVLALVAVMAPSTGVEAITRAHPILPPREPAKNFRLASEGDVLASINAARKTEEGLSPLSFDVKRFVLLSVAQQIFVVSNLERTSRGLYPAVAMVRRLDAIATSAARVDRDPVDYGKGFSSIWSSAPPSLGEVAAFADFGWMYDDGPPPQYIFRNIDCTRSGQSGCWGHRDNILSRPLATWSGCPGEMVTGSGYVAHTADGPSVAQIFEVACVHSNIGATFTWRYAVALLKIPASQAGLKG